MKLSNLTKSMNKRSAMLETFRFYGLVYSCLKALYFLISLQNNIILIGAIDEFIKTFLSMFNNTRPAVVCVFLQNNSSFVTSCCLSLSIYFTVVSAEDDK